MQLVRHYLSYILYKYVKSRKILTPERLLMILEGFLSFMVNKSNGAIRIAVRREVTAFRVTPH